MLKMSGPVRAAYYDIVYVGPSESPTVGQGAVDQPLKGRCGAVKAEGHPAELEEALGSREGCLFPVRGVHRNLPVALREVQCQEKLGLPKLVDE